MVKITIIQYTPRYEKSNTLKLLEHYKSNIDTINHEVEIIDLLQINPTFFTQLGVNSYLKRNYGGVELNEEEEEEMKQHDMFAQKIINSDVIVLAYPMYNFTLPGIVKTFFDSILQKGKTWDVVDGNFVGKMQHANLLVFSTSSGVYNEEIGNKSWDVNTQIMTVYSQFIGVKSFEMIFAQGLRGDEETVKSLEESYKKIDLLKGKGFGF
ncbi:MAG: NAD(P)H-dependent oxidoreductase [Nanoarchaeota archaeon]|nr:NAD(P)H-dependent oxidoreductase [Nanoarchaeota archaeon]